MAVILPKFTNVLVLMYGFLIVFGANGLVNRPAARHRAVREPVPMVYNLFAVLLGEVVLIMPYCVLVLVAVLHAIDPELEEAARSLGASEAQVFWHVTLPLSLPGVWGPMLLAFIWGVGAFVAPYLLGTPGAVHPRRRGRPAGELAPQLGDGGGGGDGPGRGDRPPGAGLPVRAAPGRGAGVTGGCSGAGSPRSTRSRWRSCSSPSSPRCSCR